MSALLTAAMAFLGATIAQLFGHWLTLRRDFVLLDVSIRRDQEQKNERTKSYMEAMISDVTYTSCHIAEIISGFEGFKENKELYHFENDRLRLEFATGIDLKFDYDVSIHPGLIYQYKNFKEQYIQLLNLLKKQENISITFSGRDMILDLLIYGIKMQIRLKTASLLSQSILQPSSEISTNDVVNCYSQNAVHSGERWMKPNELLTLMERDISRHLG